MPTSADTQVGEDGGDAPNSAFVHGVLACLFGIAATWMDIVGSRNAISLAHALPTVNGPELSVSRESVAAAKRKAKAQASITTCCA
jgi:hypothetical protein